MLITKSKIKNQKELKWKIFYAISGFAVE